MKRLLLVVGITILIFTAVLCSAGCERYTARYTIAPATGSFCWEYLLYLPERITSSYMLVIPNNTGEVNDDIEIHKQAALDLLEWKKTDADKLGTVLLIPIFPRPETIGHVYTHALDRDCLLIEDAGLQRLDLQLIAMIDDAIARLSQENVHLKEQVLLSGYSAAGMFANRFVLLHPERVRAAAIGSPGGWPIAPIAQYNGKDLPYPIGAADIEQLSGAKIDFPAFCQVPQFFYIGSEDTNDAAETCYFEDMREITANEFGMTPIERWPAAKNIYQELGANARFSTYEGIEHKVTDEMQEDILAFLGQYTN